MKLSIFSRSALAVSLLAIGLAGCSKKEDQAANQAADGTVAGTTEAVTVDSKWTMQPGKWEITGKVIAQGMETDIPVNTVCIDKPTGVDAQSTVSENQASSCKTENRGESGDKLRIAIICDAPVKSETNIAIAHISDQEFMISQDTKINVNGMDTNTSSEMKLKHIGQCDA